MVKKVHFAESINWEEEERRSFLGAESRRKERNSKKMGDLQRERRMESILVVLADQGNQHDITRLCNGDAIHKGIVWQVV